MTLFKLLTVLALALSLLLWTAGPTSAEQPTTVRLDPVAGSGVSGTATLTAAGGGASIALNVAGLTPGTSYRALLNAGTCATPSASFGLLGNLEPSPTGTATLTTTSVRVGAAGASSDLTMAGLADGDHVIQIAGATVVACGSIPAVAGAAAPSKLPRTGGLPPLPLAAILGAFGLAALAGGLFLRRQSARSGRRGN